MTGDHQPMSKHVGEKQESKEETIVPDQMSDERVRVLVERVAALEKSVRDCHASYHNTLRNIQNLVFRIERREDGEMVILFSEGKIAQDFHLNTRYIGGKTIREVFPPELLNVIMDKYERAFVGEETSYEYVTYDQRYFRTQLSPIIQNGEIKEVVGSIVELTEIRLAEREAIEVTEKFRKTLRMLPNFIFSCKKKEDGRMYLMLNEGALAKEFVHLNQTDDIGERTIEEVFSPDVANGIVTGFERAFLGDTVEFQIEYNGRIFSHFVKPANEEETEHRQPVKEIVGFVTDITERKQTEEILHVVAQGITGKTGVEFFRYLTKHLTQMLGVEYAFIATLNKEIEGRVRVVAICHRGEFLESVEYALKDTASEYVFLHKHCCFPEDSQKHFPNDLWLKNHGIESHIATLLVNSNGQPMGLLAVMDSKPIKNYQLVETMLTIFAVRASAELERQLAEEELLKSNAIFQATQEAAIDGMIIVDENTKIVDYNNRFKDLWQIPDSVLATRDGLHVMMHVMPHLVEANYFLEMIKELQESTEESLQVEVALKDGRVFDCYSGPILSPQKHCYGRIYYFRDITDRKKYEEQSRHQVYYDSLTKLPNRVLFNDRLELAIMQANRTGEMLAVMFIDLDRFKVINDTLSHGIGDQLLQKVANRFLEAVREGDTVSRLGGDQFQIILHCITNLQDVAKTAQNLLDAMSRSFIVDNNELYNTISIGISLFPEDGLNSKDMIKNAKAAMYRAKESGGNNYRLYTPAMNQTAFEKLSLEKDLRRAIERGELYVCYQPRIDLRTGELVGMEALVRWQHPEWGRISPVEFIPLAEESGLIIPLDEYVLRQACLQNKAWQEAGFPPLRVAVNLSAIQFQKRHIAHTIAEVLDETGLEPRYLEIEITEGVTMHKAEAAIEILYELKELGVHIAIDDFGTGYSSLSYLKKFPIDTLKIDRSFVRDITLDPDDAEIVSYIIALAHSLKLSVIAEGVETEGQRAFLFDKNCDEMQGYLFSPPLTVTEFESLLKRQVNVTGYR